MLKYRYLQDIMAMQPSHFGAVFITGPRQSGKSTLGKVLLKSWGGKDHFSFDTPQEIATFRKDPELFFQQLTFPVLLDEIQHMPEIFTYIKSKIDKSQFRSGQFILTGSQQFQMMSKVSESLAGRVLVKELYPFSIAERRQSDSSRVRSVIDKILDLDVRSLIGQRKMLKIMPHILMGGYPALDQCSNDFQVREWLSSYIQTYIQRDVREISNVSDLGTFNRLLNLVAGKSGTIINFSELGKDIGVSYKTVQNYLSILEASYVWRQIPAYSERIEKRLVKSPKGVMLDSGICATLCGIYSEESLSRSPLLGRIFESFVISEFIKILSSYSIPFNLYHFRTTAGQEVDLILEISGKLIPVEIKCSATPHSSWGKGIEMFCSLFPQKASAHGYIVSLAEECKFLTKKAFCIPVSLLAQGEL